MTKHYDVSVLIRAGFVQRSVADPKHANEENKNNSFFSLFSLHLGDQRVRGFGVLLTYLLIYLLIEP